MLITKSACREGAEPVCLERHGGHHREYAGDRLRGRIREWRIHLGAHKTASTHIQEVLAHKRSELIASGIDFIPHPDIRRVGFAQTLRDRSVAARIPGLRRRHLARIIGETLEPLRRGPDRLILSEENLLGGLNCVHASPAYHHAGAAILKLKRLANGAEVVFFLSIRSVDEQVPSAYAQALRIAPPPEEGFEAIRRKIVSEPPSWADLVQRIRGFAPNVPIVVWRHEDYRCRTEEILSVLCGRALGPLPRIEDPAWTRSPSAAAVREAETLPRTMTTAERRAAVGEIYAQLGGSRFRPFSRPEAETLRSAYQRDLARIAGMDSVRLLSFA